MPDSSKKPRGKSSDKMDAASAIEWLKSRGTKAKRDGMARYAIPSDRAFGVSMGDIQGLARRVGRNHEVAAELWATGWYEARMLAAYVEEPDQVTPAQMDRWCRDFDNWAICDTVCFSLFDRTAHAWSKVESWAKRRSEFERRAAFALLWCLTVHDKNAGDERFKRGLELIEKAASDERNFVKKAVNMALRAIGKRNSSLHAAAAAVALRLSESADPTSKWVGKDALKELQSAAVLRRLASKPKKR